MSQSEAVPASASEATAMTWEACVGPATWLHEPLQRTLSYAQPLPVQQAVIPTITRALLSGVPNDVSLTAPTGSGKTLCYLLPLLRMLTEAKKGVDDNALRCLILVPTHALGQQVFRELQRLMRPTSMRVACLCTDGTPGANAAAMDAAEAKELVRRVVLPRVAAVPLTFSSAQEQQQQQCGTLQAGFAESDSDAESDVIDENSDDGDVASGAARSSARVTQQQQQARTAMTVRYFSNVDVIVATPQRLLHHLDHTRGLRLADLRLLVIDEADQVLVGNFASQVQKVNARYEYEVSKAQQAQQRRQQRAMDALRYSDHGSTQSGQTVSPASLRLHGNSVGSSGAHAATTATAALHKVLCSATLSSRIARISQVRLRNCSYYVLDSNGQERKEEAEVEAAAAETAATAARKAKKGAEAKASATSSVVRTQFALPPTLQEHVLFVEDAYRPAVLLKLVHTLRERIAAAQAPRRARTAAAVGEGERHHEGTGANDDSDDASSSPPGRTAAAAAAGVDYPVVEDRAGSGILVFCASAEEARVMSHFLDAAGISGVVEFTTLASEAERRRALLQRPAASSDSGADTVPCVVASDALMRGIDIPNVGHVIMYHPPDAVSQYVHRAGRTARAMRPGHVHLLLSKVGPSGNQEDGEMALFKRLSQSLSRTLPVSYERLFFRFAENPAKAAAAAAAATTATTAKAATQPTSATTSPAPPASPPAAPAPAAAASVGSAEWWVEQANRFVAQSQHQLQRRWASVLESAAAVAAAAHAKKVTVSATGRGSTAAGTTQSAAPPEVHAAPARKRPRGDGVKPHA